MLRKISLTILLLFSLSGCGIGPKVATCVSDPSNHGFQCFDARTNKAFFLDYSKSENYVAFSPADAKAILEWAKRNKK